MSKNGGELNPVNRRNWLFPKVKQLNTLWVDVFGSNLRRSFLSIQN